MLFAEFWPDIFLWLTTSKRSSKLLNENVCTVFHSLTSKQLCHLLQWPNKTQVSKKHADDSIQNNSFETGAEVDKADNYGRTPLHVAAAVDYPEMVNFLISKQANIHAKTTGERQTPIHYAANNDACSSLAALLERGASIDDRDYKGRTPLHVSVKSIVKIRLVVEPNAFSGERNSLNHPYPFGQFLFLSVKTYSFSFPNRITEYLKFLPPSSFSPSL